MCSGRARDSSHCFADFLAIGLRAEGLSEADLSVNNLLVGANL